MPSVLRSVQGSNPTLAFPGRTTAPLHKLGDDWRNYLLDHQPFPDLLGAIAALIAALTFVARNSRLMVDKQLPTA